MIHGFEVPVAPDVQTALAHEVFVGLGPPLRIETARPPERVGDVRDAERQQMFDRQPVAGVLVHRHGRNIRAVGPLPRDDRPVLAVRADERQFVDARNDQQAVDPFLLQVFERLKLPGSIGIGRVDDRLESVFRRHFDEARHERENDLANIFRHHADLQRFAFGERDGVAVRHVVHFADDVQDLFPGGWADVSGFVQDAGDGRFGKAAQFRDFFEIGHLLAPWG